ncbi:peptidoglycan binding domain-containing protein [Streptomyces tsukubensis]|uniref:YoaR-like putative peptidoglycan binding domain-containing protein n=1 Tax=Streptomyces tsukubensis TaxID=83656 RepID=A0A1V4ACA1_9ACTN|nr:hypothetical protein [Streptomyces tsukubensis]OON81314.1 hypothetical protein B1H18_08185 [Streptomyces tsukubensis]QFR95568.1 hypothetical protein GBW32_24250 [Streptomyces tsukubensis]
MSRETESSSSGPQGRGGAAYPSGTPPYGSPAQSDENERDAPGADASPRAAEPKAPGRPDERKTETTLTTRIRINIPGSRPIPPVVMRTPMGEGEQAEPITGPATPEPAAEPPAPEAEEKPPSDWFAPRKGGTRGGNTPLGGSGSTPAGGTPNGGAGTPTGGAPGRASGNGGAPGGGSEPNPGGSGAFDVSQALAAGPLGQGAKPPGAGRNGAGNRPSGPTGGPTTGDGPLVPSAYPPPGDTRPGGHPRDGGGPVGGPRAGDGAGAPWDGDATSQTRIGDTTGETRIGDTTGQAPIGDPFAEVRREQAAGRNWMGDDTAVLTPQGPSSSDPFGAGPGGPGSGPGAGQGPGSGSGDNISSSTLTSGIPVVPPLQGPGAGPYGQGDQGPFPPLGPGGPGGPARFPEPVSEPAPAASPPAKKAKKGGRKVTLAIGVVVVLAVVSYGAGLLMNHSDVPKGTTVLGVDIGGGTRDTAVNKLESSLDERTVAPLPLTVDGQKATLKPSQAGLTLDSQATVRAAATSDYNPVSVIGSLFGQKRVVQPDMPVDKEKLADALERVAGVSGSAHDGTITFSPGKATPVYGKPGQALDVDKSMTKVSDAYRAQVQSGKSAAVQLPVTTRKPTVPDSEVDRMMKEFAKPAMSGIVTIEAGGKSIPLGPDRSLPQILGVKAVDGKLTETYDRTALKKLYGNTFDGVLITRGTGKKTPVTPEDVVMAMRKALVGKTPTERIGVIETDPS